MQSFLKARLCNALIASIFSPVSPDFLSRFSTVRDEYEFIYDESMSIICVVQYFTIPLVH